MSKARLRGAYDLFFFSVQAPVEEKKCDSKQEERWYGGMIAGHKPYSASRGKKRWTMRRTREA